jgi:hypothetical protein
MKHSDSRKSGGSKSNLGMSTVKSTNMSIEDNGKNRKKSKKKEEEEAVQKHTEENEKKKTNKQQLLLCTASCRYNVIKRVCR